MVRGEAWAGGWWLVVGGWWLVVGGWWLVVGGWWSGWWWTVCGQGANHGSATGPLRIGKGALCEASGSSKYSSAGSDAASADHLRHAGGVRSSGTEGGVETAGIEAARIEAW